MAQDVIARIENQKDPSQVVAIRYLREENAFVTSGIQSHFAYEEIMLPAHLVVMDMQLIGTIVSAILEKLSQSCERDESFHYASQFEVLGKHYTLTPRGPYMRLNLCECTE
jgi:hypothetical protein